MKTSLKFILLLAGLALAAAPGLRADDSPKAPAPADPTDRDERREEMSDRMLEQREHRKEMGERIAKELGLSAEQKAKMKALLRQQRDAAEAIMDDPALSREQKMGKLKEFHKNAEAQRRGLLTPEQQKKADEMRTRARERFEHRREKFEHRRERREHGRDDDRPRD